MSEASSIPFQSFWKLYADWPAEVQKLADKQFALGFARKGNVYTVEVGRSYRAEARYSGGAYYWFWIGSHEAYNKLLRRQK